MSNPEIRQATNEKIRKAKAESKYVVSQETRKNLAVARRNYLDRMSEEEVKEFHQKHREIALRVNANRVWSEETIHKMSDSRIEFLNIHPEHSWISRHYLGESYPEKRFRQFLEIIGFVKGKDFVQEFSVGRFSLDFAFLGNKQYVEIDGKQHLQPKVQEKDKKRDRYLLGEGWHGFRISASFVLILPFKQEKLESFLLEFKEDKYDPIREFIFSVRKENW